MEILHIPPARTRRVVIIGGGFAGLKLARKLFGSGYQIVIIDRNNFHQFQPLFYQVATAGLEPSAISFPLRKIFQKVPDVHVRMAELLEVVPSENKIVTSIGSLEYDYLVIATGAVTNFFGQENFIRYAFQMKSISDAIFIRNTILQNYETALNESDPEVIGSYLNVVIVGGGPTGVELAGALGEMKKYILPKDYPELDFSRMKIYLFEASPSILKGMSLSSVNAVKGYLSKLGVELRLNAMVKDYDGVKVILGDGNSLVTRTLIWAAGVTCDPVPGLDASVYGRGKRITTDVHNRVKGYENIFAIGDVALTATEGYPDGHPQVAPVAIQQARLLAKNINRIQKGKELKTFRYIDKGTLATVGQNRAVAELPGLQLKGILAWMLWTFVHLMSIVGVKNRFFIFTNWAWNYLTYDQSLRLLIRPSKRQL
jgi:NADH:ubiquinone reductase (H+-translocating)